MGLRSGHLGRAPDQHLIGHRGPRDQTDGMLSKQFCG